MPQGWEFFTRDAREAHLQVFHVDSMHAYPDSRTRQAANSNLWGLKRSARSLSSLWAAGKFHPYLCGSVIEFIHLRDLKNLIASAVEKVRDMEKVVRSMQQILELEAHLNRQFLLVKEAKRAVLHSPL